MEAAAYPESRGQRIVRVVRDGRIVATVSYLRQRGGWLEETVSNCEDF